MVFLFFCLSPFHDNTTESLFIPAISKGPKPFEKFTIFYDGHCLMCNGFLTYMAKYPLADQLQIGSQTSPQFVELQDKFKDLKEVDAIAWVGSNAVGEPIIKLKAEAVLFYLKDKKVFFKVLYWLYMVFPFLGDIIYDIVAKNRTKTDETVCPMPPLEIRKKLIY